MNILTLFVLLLFVFFFSIVILAIVRFLIVIGFLLRYKIREKMMRKLAREFTLSFRSKTPPSLKHYLLLCWWPFGLKPDWEINHIEGIINDHRVHIFDNLFSGPWFFFLPINYLKSHTTIEVDGEYLKGKEKIYKPFTLGDAYLTSVYELRRFLTKTKIQKDK